MNPTIILDMPFESYLARDAYGSSDIATFVAGPPAMVPWRRSRPNEHTDATRLGTAAHCRIIDPHTFDQRFYQKGKEEEFRTKEARALRDELLASGKIIMSHTEAQTVDAIVTSFMAKRAAATSIRLATHREASIFWEDHQTGLPLRTRPDWFDAEAVYDLKVTVEGTRTLGQLLRRAYALRWPHQAAMARAGARAIGGNQRLGRTVVVGATAPHTVWLLEYAEHDLDLLDIEMDSWRAQMRVCHDSGIWPGSPETWHPCPMPADMIIEDLEGVEVSDEEVEEVAE